MTGSDTVTSGRWRPCARRASGAVAIVAALLLPLEAAAQPAKGRDYAVVWLAGYDGEIPAKATLRFGEDGRFSGFGGCNRLAGTYQVKGDTLSVREPGRTRKLCPQSLMIFEDAFIAAIAQAKGGAKLVGGDVVFSNNDSRLIVLK
jgi:heat shock protein HslJ